MELMFLPVILLGAFYMWIDHQMPIKQKLSPMYIGFTYIFHTAMALIVNRMLVSGILQIAGTESDKIFIFDFAIVIFLFAAVMILLLILRKLAR
jgi:hypothetical protein